MSTEARISMLIELDDVPGALVKALGIFSAFDINLTHIESRPAKGAQFDFYVDCEGRRGDKNIEAAISAIEATAVKLLVLDDKQVPWFPRHARELDVIAGNTLAAGEDLESDHPGFNDVDYRQRRAVIKSLADGYRFGDPIPQVEYSDDENETWGHIYRKLRAQHQQHACREYQQAMSDLERYCGVNDKGVPSGEVISQFLNYRTGFRIYPVAGLLSSRDFLNGLAFRVFFSTQYIRHPSRPDYTPEPDVCHELLGHAPMFADAAFADLSQEIGLASLGASDHEITQLARCYWHSVEFGLVMQSGERKAYGAGVLSSVGEMDHAMAGQSEYREWQPLDAAEQDYPITDLQPVYFVADTLHDARQKMRRFAEALPRPFYAKYVAATDRIWVDRAVQRA